MLRLRLFGTPEIERDGQPLSLTRRKSRALLYYLAAHPRALTREHLLSIFWPDTERPAAQQVLRTTLHGLRKALGSALLVEAETLALAPNTKVDARTFEAALTTPHSSLTALELYRGDFLEGFSLPDTPAFEDWAAAERERYRRLAVRGLTALSQHHEADRNFTAALDALDRALAFDLLQEDVQRHALRLQYLAGDRAGAIRRYEQLRRLLDEEMGVPPMAETRAVYDSILKDSSFKIQDSKIPNSKPQTPMAPLTTYHLPFVGRAAELQQLRAFAAAGQLALIEGEPGLGKTRLAEAFLAETNALVLAGAARELEQLLPYQPLIDALRSLVTRADWPIRRAALIDAVPPVWLAEAARLLPELAAEVPPVSGADESRLWEGIHQFLSALSRQHRLVLFVDDAHWADASTLAVLGYLARHTPSDSITYLAAAREVPPRSPLAALTQTLTREGRLGRVRLTRLTRAEISTLAGRLAPQSAVSLADWLTQTSEGNPYILSELARHARAAGWLSDDGAFTSPALTSPVVPASVYTLIQSRLQRLSESARRMLDAAVAVGRVFEFDIAAHAAALSESAALDALDEVRATGLIHPDPADPLGRAYVFDHSLTMEVAYREVGEARHRLLHRRVAEALEALHRQKPDAVAGRLASHFAEGNAPERAAPYAFRAGQLAAAMAAWAEASAFYEQALLGTESEEQRAEIEMALGQALLHTGDFARASEAFRAAEALAAARADAVGVAAARLVCGQSFIAQARYSEVIEIAQSLLAGPHAARAESLWGAALSNEGADLAGAAEHLQKAAALLRDESGPVDALALGQVTFELGSVAAQQGDLPRAVQLYRDALALAESTDEAFALTQRLLAYNNLAYHLHLLGDPTAIDYARTGLRLAQEKGVLGLQLYLLSTLGEIALAGDDPDTAEQRFTEGLALAERLSAPERIAGLTANLGLVAARRGQSALAIHRLSTALARADALGTQHLAAQIRLWLVPLLPPQEARAVLAEARAIAESGGRRRLLEEAERLEKSVVSSQPSANS